MCSVASRKKRMMAAVVAAFWLLNLSLIVLALGSDPQSLFTDNTASSGSTTDLTGMEQALLNRLDNATASIDVAIYDFNRERVRDALINAQGRGVTVRVATDDEAHENSGYAPHFEALEVAGISVITDARGSIMHNKFFVIDQAFVWTGSTNMTDNGFTYNHNNSLVFTSTKLADIYTLEFNEMASGNFGTAKTDNTTHTLTYNGNPLEIYFSPTDGAMDEVVAEVNAATESIYFSIFFLTDDTLRDALIARKQAGVTIVGVWDNLGASNQYSDDEALCNAGIPIKIEDFGGKMHNKFMVIDADGASPRVVTGSMNWTGNGGDANDENTLIIHSGETAQAYKTAFQALYDALDSNTLCRRYQVFLPLVSNNTGGSVTPESDLNITALTYEGGDERVEIRNSGTAAQSLAGWTLVSVVGNQIYNFPSMTLEAGQTVRVHSGPDAVDGPPWDLRWTGAYIWNNDGDKAELRDGEGTLRTSYCYDGGCP